MKARVPIFVLCLLILLFAIPLIGMTAPVDAQDRTIEITETISHETIDNEDVLVLEIEFDPALNVRETTIAVENTVVTEPISSDGFSKTESEDEFRYEWDGTTTPATITYKYNIENSVSNRFWLEDDKMMFINPDKWGIESWRYSSRTSEPEITTNVELSDEGYVSGNYIYIGNYTKKTETVDGAEFKLIMPTDIEPKEDPEDIINNVAYSHTALETGAETNDATIFATPGEEVTTLGGRSTAGSKQMWVANNHKIDGNIDVWIHEYIHNQQAFSRSDELDLYWFIEGSANYYALLHSLEQEQITYDEFKQFLEEVPEEDKTRKLTQVESISGPDRDDRHAYTKGALVTAKTDKLIRNETNNTASLEDVFQDLNAKEEPVTNEDFIESVRKHSNDETAEKVRVFTTSQEEMPEMWDQETHEELFGYEPNQEQQDQEETDSIYIPPWVIIIGIVMFIGFLGLTATTAVGYAIYKST